MKLVASPWLLRSGFMGLKFQLEASGRLSRDLQPRLLAYFYALQQVNDIAQTNTYSSNFSLISMSESKQGKVAWLTHHAFSASISALGGYLDLYKSSSGRRLLWL